MFIAAITLFQMAWKVLFRAERQRAPLFTQSIARHVVKESAAAKGQQVSPFRIA